MTAPIGQALSITGGLRGNHESKSYDARYTGDVFPGVGSVATYDQSDDLDDTYLTGRLALSYAWNDAVTSHASVSRIYKAGGYPLFSYNAGNGVPEAPYDPAKGWSYEIGTKAVLAGGDVMLGGAIFYNDVANEHIISTVPAGTIANPFFMYVPENLDVRSYGLELEGSWNANDWLTLSGNVGYTHAEIVGVPAASMSGAAAGNIVPNVPAWTAGLAASWIVPLQRSLAGKDLSFTGHAAWRYVGTREVDSANSFEVGAVNLVDAKLGLSWGQAEVYAYGTNLLDETDGLGGVSLGSGLEAVWPRRGRTLGVGAAVKF